MKNSIYENKMQEYLGADYSDNFLRNFCLYWMKPAAGSGDEWRKKNDLDCLYFDGDLRADTLVSAWTIIKCVADFLNKDIGKKFYKYNKYDADRWADIKLLAENGDKFLPRENELVKLLYRYLELAEQRCNYILLPDRKMNCARYRMVVRNEEVWSYDQIPSTLYYIFDPNALGKYFKDINPDEWVKRERLDMGFENGEILQDKVKSIFVDRAPNEAQWLTEEEDIKTTLIYIINFLEQRKERLENGWQAEKSV